MAVFDLLKTGKFDFTKKLEWQENYYCTVWKNEKFTVTEKKFRQINSLVTSLVEKLFSRNFC